VEALSELILEGLLLLVAKKDTDERREGDPSALIDGSFEELPPLEAVALAQDEGSSLKLGLGLAVKEWGAEAEDKSVLALERLEEGDEERADAVDRKDTTGEGVAAELKVGQ
jgi:hypothetical protein